MSRTITAAELFDEIEVDLWGAKFKVREATKSLNAKMEEPYKRLEAVETDDDAEADQLVEALADVLDVLLEPLGDEEGKKVKAKTVLMREWNGDRISLGRLIALFQSLEEEVGTRRRPTNESQNGNGN